MPFLKRRRTKCLKTEATANKLELRHAVFYTSGRKYIGEWKNNKQEGKGREYTALNYQYEGDWKQSRRHGFGVMITKMPDVSIFQFAYIGNWINGKREGIGEACFSDGSWYKGRWKNGKRNGLGYLLHADGTLFIGSWEDDKFNGKGLLIMANGNRYVGEWKDGMKHGQGKFYHLDTGQVQKGIWNNDNCICSEVTDLYYRQSVLHPSMYPIPKLHSSVEML